MLFTTINHVLSTSSLRKESFSLRSPWRMQKTVMLEMPTEPRKIQAGSLVLDFTKSRISPTYAVCLANIIQKQKGRCFALRTPRRRHKPLIGEVKGTDSNASSRKGNFAAANYSPRGFRTEGWSLYKRDLNPLDPGPGKGVLKRRSVPPLEERMYFPNIVREDKVQQEWLEMKWNRKTAISVMQIAQEEHSIAELKKEQNESRRHERLMKNVGRNKR